MLLWLRYKLGKEYRKVSGYVVEYNLKTSSDDTILTVEETKRFKTYLRVMDDDIEWSHFQRGEMDKKQDEFNKRAKEILKKYRNEEKIVDKERGVMVSGKHIVSCTYRIDYVESRKETFEEYKIAQTWG